VPVDAAEETARRAGELLAELPGGPDPRADLRARSRPAR
jgi:hypothetical protein